MFSKPIRKVMERKKVLVAPPHTSFLAATKLMAKRKVSAIMVVDCRLLVGIFTERDAVFRVIAKNRDSRATSLIDA